MAVNASSPMHACVLVRAMIGAHYALVLVLFLKATQLVVHSERTVVLIYKLGHIHPINQGIKSLITTLVINNSKHST